MQAFTVVHGLVFRPSFRIVMGVSNINNCQIKGGTMGVAYHMHFVYIVLHNIMYRYTAIDEFKS